MSSALTNTTALAATKEYDLYPDISSKALGIKRINKGAVYTFDDWEGTGILTGSNAKPVPYKSSLSNVYTGFEVIGWEGTDFHRDVFAKPGLNWVKNRDAAQNHFLASLVIGDNTSWQSNTTNAGTQQTNYWQSHSYIQTEGIIKYGGLNSLNDLSDSIISWNWHYPLAKAWHANGGTTRKVPTPWGIVDSVESNASSGLTGDQVVLELYNPLTGNGCLLYVGVSPTTRTLDISGGIKPEFWIVKDLSNVRNPYAYHAYLDDATAPQEYNLQLNDTAIEANNTLWNDQVPTSSSIGIGADNASNASGALLILYYFAPVAGLQAFGGYEGNGTTPSTATGGSALPSASGCKDGLFFGKNRTGAVANWSFIDSYRGEKILYPNLSNTEDSTTNITFNSTSGMDINTAASWLNEGTRDYVYGHFGKEMVPQGDIDVYPTTALDSDGAANNTINITMEYEGAGNISSELQVYASRETTPDWQAGSFTKICDLSESRQLIGCSIDVSTQTNDDAIRWRLATNESGSYTQHDFKNIRVTWE